LTPELSHVVLAHPPFELSTAAVFAELRPDDWGRHSNDLLAPARRLRPELDGLLAAITKAGGEPRLTGSGPTIFSLTHDPDRAAAIIARLRDAGIRTSVTRTRGTAASIERITEEE
jgi:4-diphosphocytidyl-2C-methyl-D-erythritol kinase